MPPTTLARAPQSATTPVAELPGEPDARAAAPAAPVSAESRARQDRAARTADLLAQRDAAATEDERRRVVSEIVLVNKGVAVALAMRYRNRGVALEDLCQTAYEGLTKAVHRYDSELASDLLSYAVPTIRGELQRHFRDQTWMVRPPRRIQELQREVNRLTDDLTHELGHVPTREDLAERLGVPAADIAEAQRAHECFHPVSLDQPVLTDSSSDLADLLCEDDDGSAGSEARLSLAPVVRKLSERDRRLLYLRFFEDLTQAEIGAALGVSQMQVSRLLTRVLGQLRAEIA